MSAKVGVDVIAEIQQIPQNERFHTPNIVMGAAVRLFYWLSLAAL
jgi:hypothetical protein